MSAATDPSSTRPVALVTGGSRGIGRGIVLALARDHDVAIAYRSGADAAAEVVATAEDLGARAVAFAADLGTDTGADGLVDRVLAEFGRLDVLVHNAGAFATTPFLEADVAEFDRLHAVNTRAGYVLAQAAAHHMVDTHTAGSLVFVTSAAGIRPRPNMSAYSPSKAAATMLVEVLAKELGPHGIRVNAVAPGTIRTDLNRAMLDTEEGRALLLANTVLPREGRVEDVGEAVAFLVSERASFVTGCSLTVDGGATLS